MLNYQRVFSKVNAIKTAEDIVFVGPQPALNFSSRGRVRFLDL
jgi:hypothetical protein